MLFLFYDRIGQDACYFLCVLCNVGIGHCRHYRSIKGRTKLRSRDHRQRDHQGRRHDAPHQIEPTYSKAHASLSIHPINVFRL